MFHCFVVIINDYYYILNSRLEYSTRTVPEFIYYPNTAMGFLAMFTFQLDNQSCRCVKARDLKGKVNPNRFRNFIFLEHRSSAGVALIKKFHAFAPQMLWKRSRWVCHIFDQFQTYFHTLFLSHILLIHFVLKTFFFLYISLYRTFIIGGIFSP